MRQAIVAAMVWALVSSEAHAGCAEALKNESGSANRIISCLKEIEQDNISLSARINNLEAQIKQEKAKRSEQIPEGSIIASMHKCSDIGDGWSFFEEGTGRFLVGAGDETIEAYHSWKMKLPSEGTKEISLSIYDIFATGGEEIHQLSSAEMPIHSHYSNDSYIFMLKKDGNGTIVKTDGPNTAQPNLESTKPLVPAGGGKAHNNLPPYIGVYFCKRVKN